MEGAKEFLNRLVGRWNLSGHRGETLLAQSVEAKWSLDDSFVEMHFKSTLPERDGKFYAAIYFIGYDAQKDLYVMHLLDTFGAAYSRTLGLGKREGNAISFVFGYDDGSFTNKFIYDATNDEWLLQLTYLEQRQIKTFATNKMLRAQF